MKAHPIASFALALLLALAAPLKAAPIHDAAKKGDVAEVRRLLDEGADVNAINEEKGERTDGATPLIMAMALPHTNTSNNIINKELVKLLLERRADVNIQSSYGLTALMWSAIRGQNKQNREIFDLLLQKGAVIDNHKTASGDTITDLVGDHIGDLFLNPSHPHRSG